MSILNCVILHAGGTDFANGSSIVEFSSDEERQQTCPVQDVFVTIIDDDVNEADVQYFIAHLRPLSVESAVNISAVVVEQPAALCSIMDDDGKHFYFCCISVDSRPATVGLVIYAVNFFSLFHFPMYYGNFSRFIFSR